MNHATQSAFRATSLLPLCQLGVGAIAALVVLVAQGASAALALAAGVSILAVANAVFSWRTALQAWPASAGRSFARLLVGTVLKWLVIGAGLALTMSHGALDPAFVLGGAVLAALTNFLCLPWLLR